jgi:hypothetical protein
MSPQEYCRLIYQLSYIRKLEPQTMLAIFRLSKHDPILLRLMPHSILQLSNPYKLYFNQQLREIFEKIRDNIYPLRHTAELDYKLGCLYHMLGDYELALEFLTRYQPTTKTEYEYYQRIKDCYHYLNDDEQERKVIPLLRLAKLNHWFFDKKIKFFSFLNRFRYRGRTFFIVMGVIILIYFLLRKWI